MLKMIFKTLYSRSCILNWFPYQNRKNTYYCSYYSTPHHAVFHYGWRHYGFQFSDSKGDNVVTYWKYIAFMLKKNCIDELDKLNWLRNLVFDWRNCSRYVALNFAQISFPWSYSLLVLIVIALFLSKRESRYDFWKYVSLRRNRLMLLFVTCDLSWNMAQNDSQFKWWVDMYSKMRYTLRLPMMSL